MSSNFIQRFFVKKISKQLRRPSGFLGKKVGEEMNKSNRALYESTVGLIKPTDGNQLLEIGFGNGYFFEKIFSLANDLTLEGLDYSSKMVETARQKNKSRIDTGELVLHLGSSENIPASDNSFDIIFCLNVIYFWDAPEQHLREVFRVLKPGGKFYASVRAEETMRQLSVSEYGFNVRSENEWKQLLETSGFHPVSITETIEPETKIDGKLLKLKSACFIGEKPN